MSNKEILDCALSIYGKKYNNKFLEKLNNIRPKTIIKKIKNKVDDYHKKKETKKQYEIEIVDMVKQKLNTMIEEDRIVNHINIDNSKDQKEINKVNTEKIPFYNLQTANNIIYNKSKTKDFIFQNDSDYCVYRNTNDSFEILKVASLEQAIICAKDKSVSSTDIMNNFDKYKNKYSNLASFIVDKRNVGNNSNDLTIEKKL